MALSSVKIAELANAIDEAKRDGTTKHVTPVVGLTSEDTVLYSLGDPTELTGERDDPESALANLITLLEDMGILTDSTTETAA